jgi:hypothetical protein
MKRLVLAIALLSSPLAAWAECSHDQQQAMTCAEGYAWDVEAGACLPIVTG